MLLKQCNSQKDLNKSRIQDHSTTGGYVDKKPIQPTSVKNRTKNRSILNSEKHSELEWLLIEYFNDETRAGRDMKKTSSDRVLNIK